MADEPQIASLEERRHLLLAESTRLRQQLAEDLSGIQNNVQRAERVVSIALAARALWPVAAGVTGLWLGRKKGGVFRTAGKLWSLWRAGRKLISIWPRGSHRSGPPDPESSFS